MLRTYDQLISNSLIPRVEARLLLAFVLQTEKSWLLAHGDEEAPEVVAATVQRLFERRLHGEPIAYLVGNKEFYGREFAVGPGVLIPRPETEHLLEWGLEVLGADGSTFNSNTSLSALDLGCGSGCLGLSLVLEAKRLGFALRQMTLSDLSPEAIRFTQLNAQKLSLHKIPDTHLSFRRGSWFEALSSEASFDLILSNPPYIQEGDVHLHEGDLRFEPSQALSSGASGLQAIEEIIAKAPCYLKPKAWLILEHGFDQADRVQSLFAEHGYQAIKTRHDLAGHARLSAGSRR